MRKIKEHSIKEHTLSIVSVDLFQSTFNIHQAKMSKLSQHFIILQKRKIVLRSRTSYKISDRKQNKIRKY